MQHTDMNEYITILLEFLSQPLDNTDGIFSRFARLPGATIHGTGKKRVLHVPGTRGPGNQALLVAHADTYWDSSYNGNHGRLAAAIGDRDGVLYSTRPDAGLGADDRAGCAILWLLRDLGHGLLLTDGEEHGRLGSHWLREECPDEYDLLNENYNFMVQFDRRNGNDFKTYDVGSDDFRAHVAQITGYAFNDSPGLTDIGVLCRDICGVNLSTGYRNEHTPRETLDTREWTRTLATARRWLASGCLPAFPLGASRW